MQRSLKPCNYPGCRTLVPGGKARCEKHSQRSYYNPEYERLRAQAHERGYDWKWRKERGEFLRVHRVCECERCAASGNPLPANTVDHIQPHRGDAQLFWDRANWRAMNKVCHDRKTAREDGGFGNRRKGDTE